MSVPQAPVTQPLATRRARRRRANWGLRISLVVLLIASGLAVAGVRYYQWCQGSGGTQTRVTVQIPEGATGSQIVHELQDKGVVRCGTVSEWLLRRSGLSEKIRAGTYDLTTNMDPNQAFLAITKAPPPAPTVDLTIPEGYRLTQIAERVQEVLKIPAKRFLAAAGNGQWSLPPYLASGDPLEGFLFPNTYEFERHGTSAGDVIRRLLDEFRTEAANLPWSAAEKQTGLSAYQLVVVASMIEREARIEKDRPLIAAVIYKRLKDGMTLGSDATIQYIDPNPANGLTESDLQIQSPYNTRINTGLPPTPIASPGLASLKAALEPAHVGYLYYVLCGADGHHKFSTSYGQFLQDKQRCLG
ncbi:MAG: endolytic transglycosylase MltG [Actinomycetota bacterium]